MTARTQDLKRLRDRHKGLALQRATDEVDEGVGQVGEVTEGLVLDLAVLAVRAPQQVGAVDLVSVLAGRSDDVCCAGSICHAEFISKTSAYVNTFSDYKCNKKIARYSDNNHQ